MTHFLTYTMRENIHAQRNMSEVLLAMLLENLTDRTNNIAFMSFLINLLSVILFPQYSNLGKITILYLSGTK